MEKVEKVVKFTGDWKKFQALSDVVQLELEYMDNAKKMAETSRKKSLPLVILTRNQIKDHNKGVEKQNYVTQLGKRRKITLVSSEQQTPPLLKREKKQKCVIQTGKRRKMTIVCPEPQIPPLMKRRMEEISGVETAIVWLNAKELTTSDVYGHLDRLFIPKTDALKQFLTKQDIQKIHTKNRTKVVDPKGYVWELIFSYWEGVNQYVFTSKWHKLVAKNGLKPGDVVEVWGFRCENNPCFGINWVQKARVVNTDGASSSTQQYSNSFTTSMEVARPTQSSVEATIQQ